jgi:hypothetical protein
VPPRNEPRWSGKRSGKRAGYGPAPTKEEPDPAATSSPGLVVPAMLQDTYGARQRLGVLDPHPGQGLCQALEPLAFPDGHPQPR